MPDLYNGSELWDFSMVDPDNRRPVDYATAGSGCWLKSSAASEPDRGPQLARWLREWRDGRIKLAVITTLLRHRAERADLYRVGDYQPLTGQRTARRGDWRLPAPPRRSNALLIVFARHPRRRERRAIRCETLLPLAETLAGSVWREILSDSAGRGLGSAGCRASCSRMLPVAVLLADLSRT